MVLRRSATGTSKLWRIIFLSTATKQLLLVLEPTLLLASPQDPPRSTLPVALPCFSSLIIHTSFLTRSSPGARRHLDTDMDPNPETLFRPVKRRKFLRRRPEEPEDEAPTDTGHDSNSPAPPLPQDETQETVHHSDIARLRRLHRARKGGIEFSTTSRQQAQNPGNNTTSTVSVEDAEAEKARAMCDRFTGYTGQTVDVDKHMYETFPNSRLKAVECLDVIWRLTI